MFLSNSNLHEILQNIYIYLDEETNKYFVNIENKISRYFKKKDCIYNFNKQDMLKIVFYNNDFDNFIFKVIDEIDCKLKKIGIEHFKEEFNINLNTVTSFTLNSTLIKNYIFSNFLSQTIENTIDNIIEANLSTSNKALEYFFDKISPGEIMLSFSNLSNESFNKRHKLELQKRFKGILINFKIRLRNDLKSQIYKYVLFAQDNNLKTA